MSAMHHFRLHAGESCVCVNVFLTKKVCLRYVELAEIDRSGSRIVRRHSGGCAGPVGFVATTPAAFRTALAGFPAAGRLLPLPAGPKPGGGTVWQENHYRRPPTREKMHIMHE